MKSAIPGTRTGRLVAGIALVVGGIFGFLPVLGFWMVPLGLLMLSVDFPAIRRFRRVWTVRLGRRWQKWRKTHP